MSLCSPSTIRPLSEECTPCYGHHPTPSKHKITHFFCLWRRLHRSHLKSRGAPASARYEGAFAWHLARLARSASRYIFYISAAPRYQYMYPSIRLKTRFCKRYNCSTVSFIYVHKRFVSFRHKKVRLLARCFHDSRNVIFSTATSNAAKPQARPRRSEKNYSWYLCDC